MKTATLFSLASAAAFVAFYAFFSTSVDFVLLISAVFAAGIAAITVADYRRIERPLPILAAGVRISKQHLRLAA